MAISLRLNPLTTHFKTHQRFLLHKPISSTVSLITDPSKPRIFTVKSVNDSSHHPPVTPEKPRWESFLSNAASLYPVYVTVGGIVACLRPSTFSWFVKCGPTSYTLTLGFIMLVMGLTLELKDLVNLFLQRPISILFGCAAQYTIMPGFGFIIMLQVTLIAQGDVPLSVVMTVCTTLSAVILTPLLTKILAGTCVPVDAIGLSISTLQVVVAPILVGSYVKSNFPKSVRGVTPFAPLLAVLASALLACSVFSENVVRMQSSVLDVSLSSDLSPLHLTKAVLSSDFGVVMLSVLLLHFAGFFVGYLTAALGGFGEPQRRAISIEVGMQNSSLGVVLATAHFASPLVALPPAMSAVIMNIMGSSLGFFWRFINPANSTNTSKVAEE
ncbi:probable sodium/metabolite cotransporter BASS2, chloroplastic isoform X2 [Ipomoea triloba]|uniref:probable sodium/metabolite cotransporter BASS2, chloroplastic isoform X2 n=1 Tax=Ipomoea triloba TaxID=35885 RepID=UPI00125D190A|nr:probable sodium/metabolite cotransporter BASS2, chloroplastic isoform X2 [Ipomoea triloba]